MIRHVVWDWNGTLLDDVDACVATLGDLLDARGLPPVSREQYRARFGFPVRAFYEELGFSFADDAAFADLSRTFIAGYRRRDHQMRLCAGALDLMGRLAARGLGHLVVSAMETELLGQMLTEHAVAPRLRAFHGRGDLSAASKIDVGRDALRAHGLRPDEVLLVGDTLHDQELGDALGCHVILFAGGHQERGRLARPGVTVVDRLDDVEVAIDTIS